MSYFTDDTIDDAATEPLIVDPKNLPSDRLDFGQHVYQRGKQIFATDHLLSPLINADDATNERRRLIEDHTGENLDEIVKQNGFDPGFGAPGDETYEDAIEQYKQTLPNELKARIFTREGLKHRAKELGRKKHDDANKKLERSNHGMFADLVGGLGAYSADPLFLATQVLAPEIAFARLAAKGVQLSQKTRIGTRAGIDAIAGAGYEIPLQLGVVQPYKGELGLKHDNMDVANAVFAATVLGGVLGGTVEGIAGAFRKIKTGEWTPKQAKEFLGKNYDKLAPEQKEMVDMALQAQEHELANPYGPSPEGRAKHNKEAYEATKHAHSTGRKVSEDEILKAQEAIKPRDELAELQELRDQATREIGRAQEPELKAPESEELAPAPDIMKALDDHLPDEVRTLVDEIFPPQVRVQMVDEIEAATGVRLQEGSVQTETPEFKKWSDGAPLIRAKDAAQHKFKSNKKVVVEGYHGTSGASDIKEFDLNKQSKISPGFYFTPDADLASAYSRSRSFDPNTRQKGGAVYPVYMTFKKPLVLDADGWGWDDLPGHVVKPLTKELGINKNSLPFDTSTIAKIAKEKGYDGVIVKNVYDSPGEDLGTKIVYIAFESTQIKSINNRGTFDPNDPRILYQKGGKELQGSYDSLEKLVSIARAAANQADTAKHELIHVLRDLNLFKVDEWDALINTSIRDGWVNKHNIKDRYKDAYEGELPKLDDLMHEEAIAEEFAQWRAGKTKVDQQTQTLFQKIKDVLDKILKILKSNGTELSDDIFKKINAGEFRERGYSKAFNDLQAQGKIPALAPDGAMIAPKATDPINDMLIEVDGVQMTPEQLLKSADNDLNMAENVKLCAMMGA